MKQLKNPNADWPAETTGSKALAEIRPGVSKQNWPTLAGRLSQPLTTGHDAVKQLAEAMPLTPLAEKYLTETFDMDSGNVSFEEMRAHTDLEQFDELPQFEKIRKTKKQK
jgi:hypothetical protein